MEAKKINQTIPVRLDRRRSMLAHMFKVFYIVGELLAANLVIIASFYIVYDPEIFTATNSFANYLSTVPFLLVFGIIYIDYLGMPHFYRKTRTDIVSASLQFSFLMILTASTIAYFFQWFAFSRYVLLVSAVLMVIVSSAWSNFCLYLSKIIYHRGRLMIIASDAKDADHLYSKIFYELHNLHIEYCGYTCSADPAVVHKLIDSCTEVMVSPSIDDAVKARILLYCANTDKTIYVVPQYADLLLAKFRVIQFYDMPTFMIDSLGLTFQQRLLKRTFDIIFSFLALVITLPLQLAIGIFVAVTSSGPVFYSQERITMSGGVYKVYKFRTMVNQAELKYGAYQSSVDDPRVTRAGRFLRNTRLDELPQFLNILKGDMSLVGPRSDRPITIGTFEGQIPGYNQRLKVKSGLTGLAQVYGKYDTDPEDKLRFDMMYIKNYSFLLDLRILTQTIRAMRPNSIFTKSVPEGNYEMK